jgi:hypothetical protein
MGVFQQPLRGGKEGCRAGSAPESEIRPHEKIVVARSGGPLPLALPQNGVFCSFGRGFRWPGGLVAVNGWLLVRLLFGVGGGLSLPHGSPLPGGASPASDAAPHPYKFSPPETKPPGRDSYPPLGQYDGHGEFFKISLQGTSRPPPVRDPGQKFYKQNLAGWLMPSWGDLSILQATLYFPLGWALCGSWWGCEWPCAP